MRIVIPGNPIAKARPKFAVRGGHAMAYDSQDKIMQLKRHELSMLALQEPPGDFKALFSDPLSVRLEFHMQLQETSAKWQKNAKLHGLIRPSIKPDIDNLIKFWDIANGILWRDDAQIVELYATQKYSENPCTIITVESIKMTMNENAIRMTSIFSPSALEKLESDLSILSANLESLRLCQREDRQEHMECAAGTLKLFANTYSLALKKMLAK
jgi:Holliday junction resolvase RusA-like endonuclease